MLVVEGAVTGASEPCDGSPRLGGRLNLSLRADADLAERRWDRGDGPWVERSAVLW